MYSKTIIIGRLTRDVELKYSASGTAIANMSVAVDKYKKEDGADFYNVTIFKKQAENAAQYLAKGRLVMVEGRMTSREYQNKEGQNVRVWELVADNVKYLERGDSKPANQSGGNQGYDPFGNDGKPVDISDDDLPF